MIEDNSALDFSKKQSKKSLKSAKIFTFSPLDELGINYDISNQEDISELNKIIVQILSFPSTELAQIHTEAMKLGNYDLEDKPTEESAGNISQRIAATSQASDVSRKCPCCGFTRQAENIKLCTSMDDIKNIGTSTYLYFSAYKHLSILLLILGLIYSIFAIVTNLIAAGAQSNNLTAVVDYISISLSAKQLNKNETNNLYYYIQCWIGLGVMTIWIFVFLVLRYYEFKGANQYDEDTSSISDYSVVIEGIPLDVTEEELQSQLNTYYENLSQNKKIHFEGNKVPLKIARMNKGIPFYLNESELANDEMNKIQKELVNLRETFIDWIIERQNQETFSEPKQKREECYKNYEQLLKKRAQLLKQLQMSLKMQLKEKKSDELTTVFVTFQTNLARDLIVELNEPTFFSSLKGICGDQNKFVLNRGQTLYRFAIKKAPEPEDVIWSNIGLNDCSIYGRKFFTFTVTLILLGACFAIVIGLSKKQQQLTTNSITDPTARYISIIISVVIAIVNVVLSQVINFLTNYERNYTTTNRQTSLAIKSILAQMVNTILIPVIVAHYIKGDLYNTSGLVDNIFMMSITNSFVGPALVFFDPLNIVNKVMRCIKSRANSKLYQNQRDHNHLYLGPQFQVGSQCIYLVNLFMFVCYFVSLQPICVFFALVGYCMMYWVQKYCIFYRYRRPVPSSDLVNKAAYQIIMFGPVLYSLGSLTWSNFMPDGVPAQALLPNLIALGISLLITILPLNALILTWFFSDRVYKCTKYEQMRISFSSEYDRMNPHTQEDAIAEYKEFCEHFNKNVGKLSVEKQEELMKKMILNNQRGQLQQINQQASRPADFGAINFGLQAGLGAVFDIFKQPAQNPLSLMLPQTPPVLMVPQQPIYGNQSSARTLHNQSQVPNSPQPYPNVIGIGAINPTVGAMGNSFNLLSGLGIQPPPTFNPNNGANKKW